MFLALVNPLTAMSVYIYVGLPRAYIYARVEESLYNRLFTGRYKSVACQAVSITLPEGCSSGFVHWFPVWYFLQPRIFARVPNHGHGLVACHYIPVGGHTGQLRHITTLQATVRL